MFKIFTNGAFITPLPLVINGVKQWRWVVVGQEDEAYYDGEPIEVYDYADTLKGLFMEESVYEQIFGDADNVEDAFSLDTRHKRNAKPPNEQL